MSYEDFSIFNLDLNGQRNDGRWRRSLHRIRWFFVRVSQLRCLSRGCGSPSMQSDVKPSLSVSHESSKNTSRTDQIVNCFSAFARSPHGNEDIDTNGFLWELPSVILLKELLHDPRQQCCLANRVRIVSLFFRCYDTGTKSRKRNSSGVVSSFSKSVGHRCAGEGLPCGASR